MKNMERAYLHLAADRLGLAAGEDRPPMELPGPCRGWFSEGGGNACAFPEDTAFTDISTAGIPLPAAWEGIRPYLGKRGAEAGPWLWLPLRTPRAALETIFDLSRITAEGHERLCRFLSLRPCFHPSLRTGLGLLLHRNGVQHGVAALLREGCGAAPDGFQWPLAMNLELTTQCPLRCPQCYVHLQAGKHMPRETALRCLDEAGALGVLTANLSGGETMCYPWLTDVITRARENDIDADVALSGFGINDRSLDRLLGAGVSGIYVSLNGPTEEINAKTRDGYSLAISLLERLQKRRFSNTWINWVVHDSNARTLPAMLELAERWGVHGLMVMAFKPDSHNALPSLPSRSEMEALCAEIREYHGPIELSIESCYSSLRAICGQSFFGNRNRGPFRGCGAGRDSFSVDLDGSFTPCRHLMIPEAWEHIGEYWEHSPVLRELRQAQDRPQEPCRSCPMEAACRHCMAVNWKLKGQLTRGDDTCPLAQGDA